MKNTEHIKNVDGKRLFLLNVNYYKEKKKYEVVTETKKIVRKKIYYLRHKYLAIHGLRIEKKIRNKKKYECKSVLVKFSILLF